MTKSPKRSFIRECKRFEDCNTAKSPGYSEIGFNQFYKYESTGEFPENPDPFFTHLLDGKKWWEWTLNWLADMYLTHEWYGWYILATDFIDDPSGFKQLRQRIGKEWEIDTSITPKDVIESVKNNI